jgi:hypothetical protein
MPFLESTIYAQASLVHYESGALQPAHCSGKEYCHYNYILPPPGSMPVPMPILSVRELTTHTILCGSNPLHLSVSILVLIPASVLMPITTFSTGHHWTDI